MSCRAAQPGWSVSIARVKKLLTECTQVMVIVRPSLYILKWRCVRFACHAHFMTLQEFEDLPPLMGTHADAVCFLQFVPACI